MILALFLMMLRRASVPFDIFYVSSLSKIFYRVISFYILAIFLRSVFASCVTFGNVVAMSTTTEGVFDTVVLAVGY